LNPLVRTSTALVQIGRESGMPSVQRGLEHVAAHLRLRAQEIADPESDEEVARALHTAMTEAVLSASPPIPRRTWPLRVYTVLVALVFMWLEGSLQPSPGVGFAVAMGLMLGAACLPDREPE